MFLIRCRPKKYDMYLVVFSDGHICDKCNRKIAKGEQGLRSDKHDYDLCNVCAMPVPSAPDAPGPDDKSAPDANTALETNSQLKF